MKLLVIGSGGREHALVWKLSQSPRVKKIFAAPGNAGIAEIADCFPVKADDVSGLLAAARERKVDLVVVGPELPLTRGIVDLFQREQIPIFGPTKEAARLEGSKAFTKELLRDERIPTASFEAFTDLDKALDFLKTQAYPVVIKADGLAAGKGVFVCMDRAEALSALEAIFKKNIFGVAGEKVVIEEFLNGVEASFHLLIDGEKILPLATAQDHKRIGDNDQGPNTGGMGVYSPTPFLTKEVEEEIIERIVQPTLKGLKKRGIEFRGVLYAGLMLTEGGPRLLEYNVRFGDPETQAILVRLEGDLVDLIEGVVTGRLSGRTARWREEASVCVVMASHGYPEKPKLGDEIEGLDRVASMPDTVIFHAGTRREGGRLVTAGGRVLGVTAWGGSLRMARERAYDACEKIYWRGAHFRRDIGLKALKGG